MEDWKRLIIIDAGFLIGFGHRFPKWQCQCVQGRFTLSMSGFRRRLTRRWLYHLRWLVSWWTIGQFIASHCIIRDGGQRTAQCNLRHCRDFSFHSPYFRVADTRVYDAYGQKMWCLAAGLIWISYIMPPHHRHVTGTRAASKQGSSYFASALGEDGRLMLSYANLQITLMIISWSYFDMHTDRWWLSREQLAAPPAFRLFDIIYFAKFRVTSREIIHGVTGFGLPPRIMD